MSIARQAHIPNSGAHPGSEVPSPNGPCVVLLRTSPRPQSASFEHAVRLGELVRQAGGRAVVVDTSILPPCIAAAETLPDAWAEVAGVVGAADAVVVACPVHRQAVSGWTRNCVEVLRSELDGKPMIVIAAAGSPRGHIAGEAFVADLLVNFGAEARPAPIVVTPDATDLDERIVDAASWLLERVLNTAVAS